MNTTSSREINLKYIIFMCCTAVIGKVKHNTQVRSGKLSSLYIWFSELYLRAYLGKSRVHGYCTFPPLPMKVAVQEIRLRCSHSKKNQEKSNNDHSSVFCPATYFGVRITHCLPSVFEQAVIFNWNNMQYLLFRIHFVPAPEGLTWTVENSRHLTSNHIILP